MSIHDSDPRLATPPAVAPVTPASAPQPPTETMRTSIFLPPMQGMDQGPQVPSALNAAPTAHTLLLAFQRRWPIALAAGLLASLLAGLAIWVVFPAKYSTYYCAKINSNTAAGLGGDRLDEADFNVFKATQAALAKSRTVILRALDMQVGGRFIKDLGIVRNAGDPVDWLQAAIKTDFLRAPEIMTAVLNADQAEELTLLLNALASSLIEENTLIEENKRNLQIEKLQKSAKNLQSDVELKRKILNQRMSALGPNQAAIGKKLDQLEQDLREARRSLRDKQNEIAAVRSRVEQLTKRIANPDAFPIPEPVLNEFLRLEPDAQAFLKAVADARTDFNKALQILQSPNAPEMRRYQDRVDQADRNLEGYRRNKMPDLVKKYREKSRADGEIELARLAEDQQIFGQQEILLKAAVDRVETEVAAFRPQNMPVDLLTLQGEIAANEKVLDKISETIQLKKAQPVELRVSILQDAIEPHGKDTAKQMKLIAAGSVGMFLLTVLGISFLEFRSRKITSSDEVKRGLGLTVIGTVPALPDKARSPINANNLDAFWQNQLMESIDTIRTMLLHSARSNNTRVIMVTSAVPGEGKTSLASQLAASMARAWKKTLLIDGDLRNPSSHKLFDVPQDPGFSEVLRGELSATEAVRSTPLSRLWIMPAGHWDSHAVQALAQDNVRNMLEELKQQYDFIILDSCPILPVADSLLLGQNVDGVLMTVMRDFSRSPAVHAAHQRLESLGIKTLGAVVIGAKNELGPLGYKNVHQSRP